MEYREDAKNVKPQVPFLPAQESFNGHIELQFPFQPWMTGHSFLLQCAYALLLSESEANAIGTKIVHGIPFPQKCVTKNCQWANRFREICRLHISLMLKMGDEVGLPMPKKEEMQEP